MDNEIIRAYLMTKIRLVRDLSRMPMPEEVAAEMGIDIKEIENLEKEIRRKKKKKMFWQRIVEWIKNQFIIFWKEDGYWIKDGIKTIITAVAWIIVIGIFVFLALLFERSY